MLFGMYFAMFLISSRVCWDRPRLAKTREAMSIDDWYGPGASVAPVSPILLKSWWFVEAATRSYTSFWVVSVSLISTVSPVCPDCVLSPTGQVSAAGLFLWKQLVVEFRSSNGLAIGLDPRVGVMTDDVRLR
jgi:hypothetical protein